MPIDIGGDTSVKWVFMLSHAREASSSEPFMDVPWPGRPYCSNGVDLTHPDGRAYDFEIVLKVPKEKGAKKAFAEKLAKAAKDAAAAARGQTVKGRAITEVTISMPVEDYRHTRSRKATVDQIHIEWNPRR